jgi:hypothetical protein
MNRPLLFYLFKMPVAGWALLLALLTGCEQNVALELPEAEEKLVVEGHIEQGRPPIVVLTRTVPLFSDISMEQLQKAFVHQASVTISSNGKSYPLQEFSTAALPAVLQEQIEQQLGIKPGSGIELFFYSSLSLTGQLGQRYELDILHEEKHLTATTIIPNLTPVDSLWLVPHPENDSLQVLWYNYPDPDTLGNYVRYFTSRNSEPYYPGYFTSVYSDEIINGSDVPFPLERAQSKNEPVDLETYGYFGKGDTIRIRWCAIDRAHFRFWSTLEADRNSNGNPIGSPVRIETNVKGGLGIWGGYGVNEYQLIVPR